MERVDPRVAQTKRAVLGAALQLIAERGFAGATIERVAEASGVARSTIYRRWPDPSQLFVEAFEPMTDLAYEPPTGNVEADLRRYLREYAARMNDPVYFTAFLTLVDRAAREPEWAATHRAVVNEVTSRAASILRAGIASGQVKADLRVERAVEYRAEPVHLHEDGPLRAHHAPAAGGGARRSPRAVPCLVTGLLVVLESLDGGAGE